MTDEIDAAISRYFDESVSLDDPRPSLNWMPSPRQIREWGPIVRVATVDAKETGRLERAAALAADRQADEWSEDDD